MTRCKSSHRAGSIFYHKPTAAFGDQAALGRMYPQALVDTTHDERCTTPPSSAILFQMCVVEPTLTQTGFSLGLLHNDGRGQDGLKQIA